MSQLLPAGRVALRGTAWVDTGTPEESHGDLRDSERARTALGLFRRRIDGLRAENDELLRRMEEQEARLGARLEEARSEGHSLGVEEGRKQVEEELAEAFRLLEEQERAFRRAAAAFHAGAERELVGLARWMAEQVLARELPLDADRLARQLQALLEHCLDQQTVRLHLHPGDRRALLGPDALARLPRLAGLIEGLRGRLEWVEAADVPPGACRVELHDGLLDATPPAMLEHLAQSLLQALPAVRA